MELLVLDAKDDRDDAGVEELEEALDEGPFPSPLARPSLPTTGGAPRNSGYWSTSASATRSKDKSCCVPIKMTRWASADKPARSRSLEPRASWSNMPDTSIPTARRQRWVLRNLEM